MDLSKQVHKVLTQNKGQFEPLALDIFRFQYDHNPVYHDYVDALHINVAEVSSIMQVPFLPIRFFKSHLIKTTSFVPELIFESSGTTGMVNSKHPIKEATLYKESFLNTFELFYGPADSWCIIGLLPSYLERGNSSLVYMVNELIKKSGHPQSGFYLHEYDKLYDLLSSLEKAKQKTLLIGVTFALLDFAVKYKLPLSHTIIMETGGMKGRKDEMIRQEIHDILQGSFGPGDIHSEYGMTELLSQAYSKSNGIFYCPPWMKVLLRDDEDPLTLKKFPTLQGLETLGGVINIIDLANIYSCSFIATDDAGRLYPDGSFEVLGRVDNSDLRGCSLLAI